MRKKPPPIDVPKIWLDRDPRDQEHLYAALKLISALSDAYATERTFQELAGFDLPKSIKKVKRPPKDGTLIGAFFRLEDGLMFADNVICTCADCHTPLQIRPHNNIGLTVQCCFCTVDRSLKEYWAKQAAPQSPPQRIAARQP